MRVAIFIDGKNFHAGMRATAGAVRLDFPRMAAWLVQRAQGSDLWGAHYYTGIERGEAATSDAQQGLVRFLNAIELQPGFFVRRFPRKSEHHRCPHCGEQITYTQEKEVDTTMVADMLRLAAVDGFDILILASGDADLAPAVENVRALGKKVYIATWGREQLAPRLRQVAFDHIDLGEGLAAFRYQPAVITDTVAAAAVVAAAATPEAQPTMIAAVMGITNAASLDVELRDDRPRVDIEQEAEDVFLAELSNAERQFSGGYVGASYFLQKWRSPRLDADPSTRQRLLNRLVDSGRVEVYDAADGSKAIRRKAADQAPDGA